MFVFDWHLLDLQRIVWNTATIWHELSIWMSLEVAIYGTECVKKPITTTLKILNYFTRCFDVFMFLHNYLQLHFLSLYVPKWIEVFKSMTVNGRHAAIYDCCIQACLWTLQSQWISALGTFSLLRNSVTQLIYWSFAWSIVVWCSSKNSWTLKFILLLPSIKCLQHRMSSFNLRCTSNLFLEFVV